MRLDTVAGVRKNTDHLQQEIIPSLLVSQHNNQLHQEMQLIELLHMEMVRLFRSQT